MVTPATTTPQILSNLRAEPFRRFWQSEPQSHLPAQSLPDLNEAMVELYEGPEQAVVVI